MIVIIVVVSAGDIDVLDVILLLLQWLNETDDGDKFVHTGLVGAVCVTIVFVTVEVFAVVKHFVLKLFPMQTTMTFELTLLDWVWALSLLC